MERSDEKADHDEFAQLVMARFPFCPKPSGSFWAAKVRHLSWPRGRKS